MELKKGLVTIILTAVSALGTVSAQTAEKSDKLKNVSIETKFSNIRRAVNSDSKSTKVSSSSNGAKATKSSNGKTRYDDNDSCGHNSNGLDN